MPKHDKYPTPSGWQPPKSTFYNQCFNNVTFICFATLIGQEVNYSENMFMFFFNFYIIFKDPPSDLPYFVQRRRDHLFPLYLERRR